jgi:hypothetical protein
VEQQCRHTRDGDDSDAQHEPCAVQHEQPVCHAARVLHASCEVVRDAEMAGERVMRKLEGMRVAILVSESPRPLSLPGEIDVVYAF